MNYQSTRNAALTASSAEAILNGLAPDGGLYAMPALSGLDFDWKRCLTLSTQGMATEILCALLPDFTHAEMEQLVHAAYTGKFETEDLTPTVPVGEDTVLELFRGPTSAFKDVALSMLPHLMTAAKKKCGVDDEILIAHRDLRRHRQGRDGGLLRRRGHEDHRLLPGRRRVRRAEGADGHAGRRQYLCRRGARQLRRRADCRQAASLPRSAAKACSRARVCACRARTPSTSAALPRRSSITSAPTQTLSAAARSPSASGWTTLFPPATSATFSPATSPASWGFPSARSCARPTPTTCSPTSSARAATIKSARSTSPARPRWTFWCRATSSVCCSCSPATSSWWRSSCVSSPRTAPTRCRRS